MDSSIILPESCNPKQSMWVDGKCVMSRSQYQYYGAVRESMPETYYIVSDDAFVRIQKEQMVKNGKEER